MIDTVIAIQVTDEMTAAFQRMAEAMREFGNAVGHLLDGGHRLAARRLLESGYIDAPVPPERVTREGWKLAEGWRV